MITKIKGLISRTYSILPMYEEHIYRSDAIAKKIMGIISDLGAASYYFSNNNKKHSNKIDSCISSLIAINSEEGIYSLDHSIIRKVVLDVAGDLKRIVNEMGDS